MYYNSWRSYLQGPDGYPRKVDIEKKDQNVYKIKYIPDDCGRYTIDALYDGKQLPQSPIYVQSFSTGNVSTVTFSVTVCEYFLNTRKIIIVSCKFLLTYAFINCIKSYANAFFVQMHALCEENAHASYNMIRFRRLFLCWESENYTYR